MNEQLENALVEIINKSLTGIDAAKDFLSAEIPEVVQQLLTWNLVFSFVWVVITALTIIGCIWIIVRVNKDDVDDELKVVGSMLCGLATIGSAVAFFVNLFDGLQIWLAPKVWLLECAANLAK